VLTFSLISAVPFRNRHGKTAKPPPTVELHFRSLVRVRVVVAEVHHHLDEWKHLHPAALPEAGIDLGDVELPQAKAP
jgi:hypothetical protein